MGAVSRSGLDDVIYISPLTRTNPSLVCRFFLPPKMARSLHKKLLSNGTLANFPHGPIGPTKRV